MDQIQSTSGLPHSGGAALYQQFRGYESGNFQSIQSALQSILAEAQQQSPKTPLGLIVNRMPSLSMDTMLFALSEPEPATGADRTLQRAQRNGQLAAPLAANASTETWRPIILDLDGDGIETTDQAHGVAFDIDSSVNDPVYTELKVWQDQSSKVPSVRVDSLWGMAA